MRAYKVTFEIGDSLVSSMNATLDEARNYYLKNIFNFGDNDWHETDLMLRAVSVEEVL